MSETLEEQLRKTMERREADMPVPASAPPGVVRRARKRQVVAGIVGGAVAVLVVVASFIGVRDVWVGTGQKVGGYLTETSTVDGVFISYPAGWHFENTLHESGANTTVLFVLGNYTPPASFLSVPDHEVCRPTAAVLAVQETLTKGASLPPSWPVELKPNPASPARGCGSAETALWIAHGRLFQAYALFGRNVSGRDQAALDDAFSSMQFGPATEQSQGGGGLHAGGTVVARGTTSGRPWTVSVEGSGRNLTVSAEAGGRGVGMGLARSPMGRTPALWVTVMRLGSGPGVPRLVFGLAAPRVSSVNAEPTHEIAKLYPIPGNTLEQVFVLPMRFIASKATLVAEDESGKRLATERIGPDLPAPSPAQGGGTNSPSPLN
jgi:hypothetical protein